MALLDEQGRPYRAQSNLDTGGGTEGTLAFLGTGELPQTLRLYLYTAWEGAEAPDLAGMDSILLTRDP